MSDNPAYPDAHPTAPGGMSQKALVAELVGRHGWDKAEAKAMKWPEQIDAVCEERLNREREAGASTSTALFQPDDETLDYRFDNHAGAGPSGAERWMTCTASLGASRAFLETLTPNQQVEFAQSSGAARQGTTAHAAAEVEALLLLGRMEQDEADMTLLELSVVPEDGEFYDEEMGEYITEYVDLIRTYAHDRGDENVLIEARVSAGVVLTGDYEDEVHEITGSADLMVLPTEDDPELVVGDLKYGNGMDVSVEGNPQIRIYALGALGLLADDDGNLALDCETVRYHIVQPRLGGIKTWGESLDDLLDWRDEVLAPTLTAALHGEKAGAVYAPSEKACQFCPARGGCAALAEQRVEQAAGLFDAVTDAEFNGEDVNPIGLSDTRLGELLEQITGLIDLHKNLKEEAQRRLYRGDSVPGFKLVSYTPPRKWSSDAAEVLADNDKMWKPPTLVTPTQAIKILGDGAGQIEDLIESPDKRPVVAPANDRRKDWTGRPPEAMFDDETGE